MLWLTLDNMPYVNDTKPTTSYSNDTENSTSYSNDTENSTTYSNDTENSTTYSNDTENSTTYSADVRNTGQDIAFDSFTNGGETAPDTSLTFSHTTAGASRYLVIPVFSQSGDIITSVTYAGIEATLVAEMAVDVDYMYLFQLANPAIGTNNVIITASASGFFQARAASYKNVRQDGQPDVFVTDNTQFDTNVTAPITTLTDRDWVLIWLRNSAANITAVSNLTIRETSPNSVAFGDSNGVVTPAGSFTQTASAGFGYWGVIQIAIKPGL